jgi:sodium-dependent phosphate cotransporter
LGVYLCFFLPGLEVRSNNQVDINRHRAFLNGLYITGVLLLFLYSIDLMTSALRNLSPIATESIIVATSNPFTSFLIGVLATAMVQSSSTTTSIAVALVASQSISLESAIPIIMGANVGTTITSTIVALGFIDKKKELRRALAAGTYHDFFNILTALILFPLEYYYGFLSGLSVFIANAISQPPRADGGSAGYLLVSALGPLVDFTIRSIGNAIGAALLAFALLFASIILFRRLLTRLLDVQEPKRFSRFFFTNSPKAFFWGLVTTAAIRSSTVTTTLVVPLAARKVVSLRRIVPFIIGANFGTTITAFLAALMNAESVGVIALAIAHALFNGIGFLAFYPVAALRNIPIALAAWLGRFSQKYRLAGFAYVLTVFFFIPFILVYVGRGTVEVLHADYVKEDMRTGERVEYRMISRMNRRTGSGEWQKPDEILTVNLKNNVLFTGSRIHMFNQPGFCWDGEDDGRRFKTCVQDILPRFTVAGIAFDSVYVYQQRFVESPPSGTTAVRYYISVHYPLILKREVLDTTGTVICSEVMTSLTSR